MKPELISFKLCPFVQRSVIVLLEKGVEYDINYIDIRNPPDWFQSISPLGKVPVLRVGDEVLFESAVIMEYLDEVNPPSLHPAAPLRKAKNRAWIEFASALFMGQYQLVTAREETAFSQTLEEMRSKLAQLEQQVTGPYFNGDDFNLIDAAYAPLFMRMGLLESWSPLGLMNGLPKVSAWAERLSARESVKNSVVKELPELYRNMIANGEGYAAERFG